MRQRSRLISSVLVMIVLGAILAAGCGATDTTPVGGVDTPEQRLRVALRAEPTTLDPHRIADADDSAVAAQLFSSLTRVVGDDLEVVPDLAEALGEASDDGTVVTYRLREDLAWSNGEALTAQDVVDGILRALDPNTGAGLAYLLHDIEGAADYNDCERNCDRVRDAVGVSATDERTVEFRLVRPLPWFDQLMGTTIAAPVYSAAVDQHGDEWTDVDNIVTSGPFTLVAADAQRISLARNDEWWDAGEVSLEEVTMEIVTNQSAAYRQFLNEELDAGFPKAFPGGEDIDEAKTDTRYMAFPSLGAQYLYLNTRSPRLRDPNVRRAIAIAIDRTRIVDRITGQGEEPVVTVAPPGVPGFQVIEQGAQGFIQADIDPDTGRAEQLLEEAGAPDNLRLSLYFSPEGSDTAQLVAQAIQDDLGSIGIEVRLTPLADFNALYDLIDPPLEDRIDMVYLGWLGDYGDAHAFYDPLTCENPFNAAQFCDDRFDEVVQEIVDTQDAAARFQKSKEAEALLTGPDGAFPLVPLYSETSYTMVQDWVEGMAITPLGGVDLTQVRIIDKG